MGVIIPFLVFATVFLLIYTVGHISTQTRRRVLKRIRTFEDGPRLGNTRARGWGANPNSGLNRLLRKLGNTLTRAEIDLPAKDFLSRWGVITFAGAILAWLGSEMSDGVSGMSGSMTGRMKGPLIFVLFFVVSYLATSLYVKARSRRRLIRFEEGLPDMLSITANSLRTGYSFLQAVQVVCENMRGPVRAELSRVVSEIRIGVPLEEAFRRAGERVHSEDFNLIITAVLIQRQVGGNLAEVLDSISHTIRDRIRLKREIKVLTTQGRMSGIIFMVLPAAIGFLIYVISPSYIGVLFQSSTGYTMLFVALIGQVVGFFIIRRIVRIEA